MTYGLLLSIFSYLQALTFYFIGDFDCEVSTKKPYNNYMPPYKIQVFHAPFFIYAF